MARLSKKRRIKRIIYSKPIVIILLIIALFMTYVTWSAYDRMAETQEEVRAIQNREKELSQKRTVLQENIEHLETPVGIEEELRERYSAAKEGERMVVIVDQEPTTTPEESKEGSWWQWLKSWF